MRTPSSALLDRRHAPTLLGCVLLVLVMLYGGWRIGTSATPPAPTPAHTLRLGHALVTVTHVERVTGLTDADLSGMGHGIQGLVRDDDTLVRVSLRVSAGDQPTPFDAGRLRLTRGGHPHGLAPVGGSVGRGTLSPHGSVEGALSFVVPRDGSSLQLGTTGTTARLALHDVDEAPPGAGHGDMPGMNPIEPDDHTHTGGEK